MRMRRKVDEENEDEEMSPTSLVEGNQAYNNNMDNKGESPEDATKRKLTRNTAPLAHKQA